ncbi:hypothetical protein [Hyunsoonleella pacifica]|uniref:Uncharacterized protein n=1 Tax=Hyunsoonleella pacifica TaxID=1080224 RepID=A0A4Q9FIK1_9FLAO|nr:hypothetical protein [Hyunsoonleella pacifica]TBN11960.1 hypothetical protein EYD46_17485 [Hyunsoonleella pacifica]
MASYKKTFKHTLHAKRELNTVEKNLSNNENLLFSLAYIKDEISYLNKIIGGQTSNPQLVQQNLLDFISQNEQTIDIVTIEDVHLFSDNDFLIYSNQIVLEGNYKDLIFGLYNIEKRFKDSRVASARFFSKKNYRTNSKKLFLKIILQNYENIK